MNKFEISIVAEDKFSKMFARLEQWANRASKPLAAMNKAGGSAMLAERAFTGLGAGASSALRGVDGLARSLGVVESHAASIFSLGGSLTGPLGALSKLAGLGAGIGLKSAMDWGAAGHDASVAGKAIGMSAQELLTWESAGVKAGLAAGTMTTALQNLARFAHSALWDPEAQQGRDLLQVLGITVETKNGIVNTTKLMQDFVQVLGQISNPHTRERVAGLPGIGAAMPLLQQGGPAVRRLREQAASEGIPGARAIEEADRYSRNVGNMKTGATSYWRRLGSGVLGFVNDDLERLNAFLGVNTGGATGRWEASGRRASGVVTQERAGLDGITPEAIGNLHLTAAQRREGTSPAEIAAALRAEYASTSDPRERSEIASEARRHSVNINVNIPNAPPGTSVTTTSSGPAVNINRTMPGVP